MTQNPLRILIVDDDMDLRQLLSTYLGKHGYDPLMAADADADALDDLIVRYVPDLIVLDRMLPCGDGLNVCRDLRQQGEDVPIILLTAKDEIADRIMGLESGADDYLGKPFEPRELLARIQAVLRRKSGPSALRPLKTIQFGEFSYDQTTQQLRRGEALIHLTSGELSLLDVFIQHAGKPLSRERLLTLARDDDAGERNDRAIDIAILRLRRLLEDDPKNPRWIQTVWGVGYRFMP